MTEFDNKIINFIWQVATDVLYGPYKRGQYRYIILPMVVIRRLDSLLEFTKDKVLKTHVQYKDKLTKLDSLLMSPKTGSGYKFYNTSPYTLKKLLNEPKKIRENFELYLDGFNDTAKEIISKFEFKNQLDKLEEHNLIYLLIQKFCSTTVNFSPEPVKDKDGNIILDGLTNHGMGYVYEELIRQFNEENNEEAGDHFTPREIIDLMTRVTFLPVKDRIKEGTFLVYDPCCGSGGMLTESKHFITDPEGQIRSLAQIFLFGQEISDETYAICKSDLLIKGDDPNNIAYGSTLSNDGMEVGRKFDFMLTNPPYGKPWKADKDKLTGGGKEILDSRFSVGTPNVGDGQLMFVQHMLSKMKQTEQGSRIASVHSGSALFSGDAGQGETEIRKHIITKDMLECVIALPKDMFYNTGIPTYVWVITNRKSENRKSRIQLIDATSDHFYQRMRKGMGKKQNEMLSHHIQLIADLYMAFEENKYSKIFDNDEFGYRKVIIQRPQYNEKGEIEKDSKGRVEYDKDFKDSEKIPLKRDIKEYMQKEVLPYLPDAEIDKTKTKIGYEIIFNNYFYKYTPVRNLKEILEDIRKLEAEADAILNEVVE